LIEDPPLTSPRVRIGYAEPRAFSALKNRWITAFALAPILFATAVSIWYSVGSLVHRLAMPFPQNPWESAILADAFRAANGQDVYERLTRGHATHLYGPLTSQVIGAVYRLTGPSLYTGRVINLIGALATCAIVLALFVPRRDWLTWLVAAGLLLGLHYRGRAYFVETRPDMSAMLLATLSILCAYRAQPPDDAIPRWGWYIPAVALALLAFLFKQTYAACAAVPVLAVLLTRRRREGFAGHFLLALSPLVAVAGALLLMKLVTPVVYFYTVQVPSMYEVSGPRLALASVRLITLSPLFLVLLGWFIFSGQAASRKMTWVLAAVAVGMAASIPAYAKRGGSYNSLLLGWVPMTVFCIALLPAALDRLRAMMSPVVQVAGGLVIGVLILVGTFCVEKSDLWNWTGAHGGAEYARVVEAVKGLNGRVVCPDDPTITMFAKASPGRSMEAELDANGRKSFTTGLRDEIRRANWLITVHSTYDDKPLNPRFLSSLGFRRVRDDERFSKTYGLWRRVKLSTAPATTRVAPRVNG
jgi:hypothetical protein